MGARDCGYEIKDITLGAGDNNQQFGFAQTCEVEDEPTGGTGGSGESL